MANRGIGNKRNDTARKYHTTKFIITHTLPTDIIHNKPHTKEAKLKMSISAKKRKIEHCKKCGSFLGKKEHKCRPNQNGEKHWNWKGGVMIQKGYRFLLVKEHPSADKNGYVTEHRLVMEKELGRYLNSKEVVHHINENILDNRIENLKLFKTKGKHTHFHAVQRGQASIRPNNYVYTDEHKANISKGIKRFYEQKRINAQKN